MKFLAIIFSLFLSAALVSCRTTKVMPVKTGLIGQWQWVLKTGGFAGVKETPASTGNQITLSFSADSSYKGYFNNVVDRNGIYGVVLNSKQGGQTVDVLKLSGQGIPQSFKIVSDTLYINELVADGFNYKYVRIRY